MQIGQGRADIRLLALQLALAIVGGVALLHQLAQGGQLLLQQGQLRLAILLNALVGLLQCPLASHPLFERLNICLQLGAAGAEQLRLVLQLQLQLGILLGGLQQLRGKLHLGVALLLGNQAPLRCQQRKIALAHIGIVGLGHGIVQAHQHLIGLHLIAFAHQHLFDNAAAQMLHRLALGIQRHRPRAGHALIQRRKNCPD